MSDDAKVNKPTSRLTTTMQVVKCTECGMMHEAESETFMAIQGNITIGLHGGIIGNNLDEGGRVAKASIYCRDRPCFGRLLNDLRKYDNDVVL